MSMTISLYANVYTSDSIDRRIRDTMLTLFPEVDQGDCFPGSISVRFELQTWKEFDWLFKWLDSNIVSDAGYRYEVERDIILEMHGLIKEKMIGPETLSDIETCEYLMLMHKLEKCLDMDDRFSFEFEVNW